MKDLNLAQIELTDDLQPIPRRDFQVRTLPCAPALGADRPVGHTLTQVVPYQGRWVARPCEPCLRFAQAIPSAAAPATQVGRLAVGAPAPALSAASGGTLPHSKGRRATETPSDTAEPGECAALAALGINIGQRATGSTSGPSKSAPAGPALLQARALERPPGGVAGGADGAAGARGGALELAAAL